MKRIAGQIGLRHLWVAGLLLTLACNALSLPGPAAPQTPPAGTAIVPGGITATQPFFGKLKNAKGDEVGDFLLATCGCGFWRVLAQMPDGAQFQFTVQFYATPPYVPTGLVDVFGVDGGRTLNGSVDQDAGQFTADLYLPDAVQTVTAKRGDSHSLDIQACVMCHVGDDPIFPRPATHLPGVTNCFDCHSVTIK